DRGRSDRVAGAGSPPSCARVRASAPADGRPGARRGLLLWVPRPQRSRARDVPRRSAARRHPRGHQPDQRSPARGRTRRAPRLACPRGAPARRTSGRRGGRDRARTGGRSVRPLAVCLRSRRQSGRGLRGGSDVTRPVAADIADEILGKTRRGMQEDGFDVIVATSPENVAYTSGASPPSQKTVRSRLAAAIVPLEGATELVAVSLEGPVVREQSRLDSVQLYEEFVDAPVDVVARSLEERGLDDATIGIEITHLSHADYAKFAAALPKARLSPADALLSELRTIKTAAEIVRIREIG